MKIDLETRRAWFLLPLIAASCFADAPMVGDLESTTGSTSMSSSPDVSGPGTTAGETGTSGSSDPATTTNMTTSASSDESPDESGEETGRPEPFCANLGFETIICTDFDDDLRVPTPWESIESSGQVTVSEWARAPSPPNVLQTVAIAAGDGAEARLSTQLEEVADDYTISFRVELDEACQMSTIAQLSFESDTQSVLVVDVRLSPDSGELQVVGDMSSGSIDLDGVLIAAAGPWLELTIEVHAPTGQVDVFVDGVPAGGGAAPPAADVNAPPRVLIGLGDKFDFSCEAWFDDIVVY